MNIMVHLANLIYQNYAFELKNNLVSFQFLVALYIMLIESDQIMLCTWLLIQNNVNHSLEMIVR